MTTKKKATKRKTTKKASKKSAKAAEPETPPDLREHREPTPANLKLTLQELDEVLKDLPQPEEPKEGDLVNALMHFEFCRELPAGFGQECVRRIETEFVDRNEFRVTEAFEIEELMVDLDMPEVFERCLAVHNSVQQIYNDQNSVSLAFMREASITDRNHFFGRVPAIRPEAQHFLVSFLGWEEICISARSSLRTQQRFGLDPKAKAVSEFIDEVRQRFAPWGQLPIQIAPGAPKGKVHTKHDLSPAEILLRLAPPMKKGRKG